MLRFGLHLLHMTTVTNIYMFSHGFMSGELCDVLWGV
jgi:hypothetical protein